MDVSPFLYRLVVVFPNRIHWPAPFSSTLYKLVCYTVVTRRQTWRAFERHSTDPPRAISSWVVLLSLLHARSTDTEAVLSHWVIREVVVIRVSVHWEWASFWMGDEGLASFWLGNKGLASFWLGDVFYSGGCTIGSSCRSLPHHRGTISITTRPVSANHCQTNGWTFVIISTTMVIVHRNSAILPRLTDDL